MSKVVSASVASLMLSLCGAVPASGQATSVGTTTLPRGFLGTGLMWAASDAESRMRLFGDGSSRVWTIEGGVAVSSRVGLGVELAVPSAVIASTSGSGFRASGRQEERVLLGLVRVRAAGTTRWGLDVVGGAGVLFQHHELQFAPCNSGCANTTEDTLNNKAPAVTVGAEMPFLAGSHFGLSPFARLYLLHRGEHFTQLPVLVPWQYEWESSTRVAIGVTGRLVW